MFLANVANVKWLKEPVWSSKNKKDQNVINAKHKGQQNAFGLEIIHYVFEQLSYKKQRERRIKK